MVAVERPALSSATDNEEHSIGGARMYKSRRGADQSFVAGTTDKNALGYRRISVAI